MDKKIKVLHVVVDMGHGGYENYLMNIFRQIDRTKFEFNFLVFKGHRCYFEDEIESLGGKVFHCTYSDDFKLHRAKKQLREIFNNNEFDIVHYHSHYYSFLTLPLLEKKNVQIILHSHNSTKEKTLKGRIVRLLSKYPSRKKYNNLACSNVAGEYFFGKKGKFTICPNCIQTEGFLFDEKAQNELMEKYSIKNGILVLGNIGRFAPVKNHNFMIRIANELSTRGVDYKLCFCGVGVLKDKIINQVQSSEAIKNNVIFMETGDVRKYYSLFDIFLLPSFSEGFPLTMLESQASGCYSLASNTITNEVDLTPIIKYLEIGNPKVWADAIVEASKNLPKDRKQFNEAIKNSIYDVKNACEFLVNYYLKIYGNK